MSNRLFQGIIHQMKDVVDRCIGILDETGNVVVCSDFSKVGENREKVISEIGYSMEATAVGGYTYKAMGSRAKIEYVVFVEGNDELANRLCGVIAVSLNGVKQFYDEKYDRTNFVKNVILDNILPGDIYVKSKELHFPSDVSRVVFLIRIQETKDYSTFDIIQNLFPEKNKDFVISINESDIVLVKEVAPSVDSKELEKIAKTIVDTLYGELYVKAIVGIGSIATSVKDMASSFKDAQVALEVGKVFDTEKVIINYENLGIGRLIYQLPTTLCEMFLQEVFKKGSIESLDHETLFTIQKFFENNLNVSETSRKLFVHRNTLVYRLEKIRKITGLDLREFDHAIIFKVALMVKRYLVANPTKF
jgi:carbohydrate diacid regulator